VVLAEWCADHYVDNDNEKLKCLDLGAWISLSIRVSTEVEQQRRLYSRSYDNRIDDLENALGTVKRITSIKEALKDRLISEIDASLFRFDQSTCCHGGN
jgi:hypothetical protein